MSVQEPKQRRFNAAIIIASDRSHKGVRPDRAGPQLKERLEKSGYEVTFLEVLPDVREAIKDTLKKLVREDRVNLILVSGGTGLGPNDVTPEATLEVIERRIPGMEEAMRRASFERTPHAILSRAVVGSAGRTLIVNLPGSPTGAVENLEVVQPSLEHALELLNGGTPDP
ncbi:MAG: MogA/MoaB family molybdenum cofactor biosynthesis protein [Candidatus Zixiibacteriota bacterium]|nr:MAG: MogA/MoaB family molybdenum cofactor biosynthesis protein [candidate division Zixibacteria bacterium]